MSRPPRHLVLDLHGHDVVTACELALERVREAYLNGYQSVEILHGARDVSRRRGPEAESLPRGRIKSEILRMYDEGQFSPWIDSRRTWPKAASLLLYLKPNPRPRPESWLPEPKRRYR